MGTVPKETIERLSVLYMIGSFDKGIFGRVRLHKVAYFAFRDVADKPLEFVSWNHGEWSPKLQTIVEQLASMGYVLACPLDTGDHGNQYIPASRDLVAEHGEILGRFSPELRKAIDQSVEKYGYHPQSKLLELAKDDELYLATGLGETIFAANLPDMVEIPGLDDEEADGLVLSLDPAFVCAARGIVSALDETKLDFSKVEAIDAPP